MTRIEQAELQEIVSQLEDAGFVENRAFGESIDNDPAFQRLKELAYQERYPEGSDHLLIGKSWKELEVMRRQAYLKFEDDNEDPKSPFNDVVIIIEKEIERRLLAIIPKDK